VDGCAWDQSARSGRGVVATRARGGGDDGVGDARARPRAAAQVGRLTDADRFAVS